MINQLYNIFGIAFYLVFIVLGITIYLELHKMYRLINMDSLSLSPVENASSPIETYKERLIAYRVKTEDDLNKMTPTEVSLYLKHEQVIVDSMSDQVTRLVNKAYTTSD